MAFGSSTPASAIPIHEQVPSSYSTNDVAANAAVAASNAITLGVAADMSGDAEWIGWRQVNAMQLAVEQINAAGGIDIGGSGRSGWLPRDSQRCLFRHFQQSGRDDHQPQHDQLDGRIHRHADQHPGRGPGCHPFSERRC